MVMTSNQDSRTQEIYRQNDHTAETVAGVAALGGLGALAYGLLTKGKGVAKGAGKNVRQQAAADGVKNAEETAVQQAIKNKPKAPEGTTTVYPNGQQGMADEIVKAHTPSKRDGVNKIKQKQETINNAKNAPVEPGFDFKALQEQEIKDAKHILGGDGSRIKDMRDLLSDPKSEKQLAKMRQHMESPEAQEQLTQLMNTPEMKQMLDYSNSKEGVAFRNKLEGLVNKSPYKKDFEFFSSKLKDVMPDYILQQYGGQQASDALVGYGMVKNFAAM